MHPAPMMTVSETAALFGVAPATVFRWVRAGKLLHVRTPGDRIRVPIDQPLVRRALSFTEEGYA